MPAPYIDSWADRSEPGRPTDPELVPVSLQLKQNAQRIVFQRVCNRGSWTLRSDVPHPG
jgi:hypothetical protein